MIKYVIPIVILKFGIEWENIVHKSVNSRTNLKGVWVGEGESYVF